MMSSEAETAVRAAAMKTVAQITRVLDAPDLNLTPRDLSVLADALRHAAGVLGIQMALDDSLDNGTVRVLFSGDAADAAR